MNVGFRPSTQLLETKCFNQLCLLFYWRVNLEIVSTVNIIYFVIFSSWLDYKTIFKLVDNISRNKMVYYEDISYMDHEWEFERVTDQ